MYTCQGGLKVTGYGVNYEGIVKENGATFSSSYIDSASKGDAARALYWNAGMDGSADLAESFNSYGLEYGDYALQSMAIMQRSFAQMKRSTDEATRQIGTRGFEFFKRNKITRWLGGASRTARYGKVLKGAGRFAAGANFFASVLEGDDLATAVGKTAVTGESATPSALGLDLLPVWPVDVAHQFAVQVSASRVA